MRKTKLFNRVGISFLGISLSLLAGVGRADEARADHPATTLPSVPELLKQRIESAEKAMKAAEIMYQRGTAQWDDVAVWTEHWLQARLDSVSAREERIKILNDYLEVARKHERSVEGRFNAGISTSFEMAAATYDRLDAELRLAREIAAGEPGLAPRQAKSDSQLLQGTWKVVKKVKNGEPEDTGDKPVVMKFTGDNVAQSHGDNKSEGTFSVDESKSPRRISMTGTSGEKAGSTYETIYELTGDSLKIAFGTGANAATPPADFTGGPGEGVMILERQKP